ncbi:hypothetical protein N665_0097s0005 [Sinapis alba]|nr:hypothetical protein N665_0097s0005 [Sinapis alba]KAF8109350.1 hypothetical protein N665_0097s0005 [Sinapis alba]
MDKDTVSSFGTPEMMARRDSTGKAIIASKPKEKEIPRYLRASTGSCHDICKYGKKQVTVEKPWRSTNRKIFKKVNDDALVETLKPGSSKTKKVAKKKETPDDSSSEMMIKREVVKHQVSGVSSGTKKPEVLIIPSGVETPVKQIKKKVTSSSKLKLSPDLGSRSVDAAKPKVLKKSYSALATSKPKVNSEKVASSSVLKPKIGSKSEDTKMKKAAVPSRVALKKVPVTPRASLSPRVSMRLTGTSSLRKSQSLKAASSSSSNQKLRRVKRTDESNKQIDGYPVEEKTLHVVEMETKSKVVSEHDQNQQCVAEPFPPLLQTESTEEDDECPVSETEEYDYPSGSNEAESVEEEIGTSNGERKPRVRKEGESAEEAARKLHFRRGKVVDADDVGESARKLKFRRGRDLGEDKAQDAQVRRSFKKREDVKEDEEEDEDGEKVVLRHQDVQEKDAQGLLNNVIEETASKLVEARKSKVKALVGAFETVISLQESKPPANSETGNSSPV